MRDIRFPRQSPPETTVAEFQLHCFAESGNSYKPALYLALAGLDWEPIFVDYIVGGETRTDRYREDVNAMGESPVLTHRGRRISQSGAILTYLSDVTGHFAPAAEDRYEAMRWILFDNHKFTSYTATLRFMLNFAKTGETPVTEFLRARAKSAYAIVDKHLATRDFIAGRQADHRGHLAGGLCALPRADGPRSAGYTGDPGLEGSHSEPTRFRCSLRPPAPQGELSRQHPSLRPVAPLRRATGRSPPPHHPGDADLPSVAARYQALIQTGVIETDAAQKQVVARWTGWVRRSASAASPARAGRWGGCSVAAHRPSPSRASTSGAPSGAARPC